jgi:16S rRNA processing protein RimM
MNFNSIGKIVACFGVNGELVVKHVLRKKTDLNGLEKIFIELHKGDLIPYFIVGCRAKTDSELLILLEGVSNREQALQLNQKAVWLAEEDFALYAAKTASVSLLGFHIIHDGADIGEILEVIEQPHQVLCRIDLNGKEALIPLHDNTLIKIDQALRQLVLNIPDGLLDLYR